MPAPEPRSAPIPADPAGSRRPRGEDRGQAMVEFAAVLLPLVLVLVGIIQFGFLFAAYVGVSNAAREAAREGTIYRYSIGIDPTSNDVARCNVMLVAADASLDPAVPGDFSGTCSTAAGGGDLSISYPDSSTCPATSRTGCQVEVRLTYHQPIFVPLISTFLTTDASNRFALSATVTMVIN